MTGTTDELKHQNDPESLVKKKSLIMTLGNAKDLESLLEILNNEDNEELILQIIIIIGAIGRKTAVPHLKKLISDTKNEIIKSRAKEAIEVISDMSNYRH